MGLYLAAWAPVAGLLAWLLVRLGSAGWAGALATALPLAGVYAFVCLSSSYLCRALPLRASDLPRTLFVLAGAAAVSAALWLVLGEGWTRVLQGVGLSPNALAGYQRGRPALFGIGVLLFLLAAAAHYVKQTYDASRAAEKRALQFQLLSRETELGALRAQIHPHFLFNALNSISALTSSDPPGARSLCILLGDFLRRSLSLGARPRVPLADELALVERLLAVEQVRFGERLSSRFDVQEATRECLVPPLVLQPLVENAVTHGIASVLEGGEVRVAARLAGARLELTVENPRDPQAARRRGAGVGLDNVRKRLAALYGRDAQVLAQPLETAYRTTLRFPAELPKS